MATCRAEEERRAGGGRLRVEAAEEGGVCRKGEADARVQQGGGGRSVFWKA